MRDTNTLIDKIINLHKLDILKMKNQEYDLLIKSMKHELLRTAKVNQPVKDCASSLL